MMVTLLVVAHLLGACVWIGGHIVLVAIVLPRAMTLRDPERVREFERAFGRMGLLSLVVLVASGLWLAALRFGGLGAIFSEPTPSGHLVLTKMALLVALVVLAGHAYHSVLPRMTPDRMRTFAAHAWTTTVLSILLLVAGAGVRLGGLF